MFVLRDFMKNFLWYKVNEKLYQFLENFCVLWPTKVQTTISDGSTVMPVSVDFCVSHVTAPVLSLGKVVEEGIEFFFSKSKGCWMSKDALDPEATSISIEQASARTSRSIR